MPITGRLLYKGSLRSLTTTLVKNKPCGDAYSPYLILKINDGFSINFSAILICASSYPAG